MLINVFKCSRFVMVDAFIYFFEIETSILEGFLYQCVQVNNINILFNLLFLPTYFSNIYLRLLRSKRLSLCPIKAFRKYSTEGYSDIYSSEEIFLFNSPRL